jgi:hypothetical protein
LLSVFSTGLLAVVVDAIVVLLDLEEDENLVPNNAPRKKSGKQKRAEVVAELRSGRSPLDILESMTEWSPPVFWGVVDYLHAHRRVHEALEVNHSRMWNKEMRASVCSIFFEI